MTIIKMNLITYFTGETEDGKSNDEYFAAFLSERRKVVGMYKRNAETSSYFDKMSAGDMLISYTVDGELTEHAIVSGLEVVSCEPKE